MEEQKKKTSFFSVIGSAISYIGIFNLILMIGFPILVISMLIWLRPTIVLDYPTVKLSSETKASTCYQTSCSDSDYTPVSNIRNSIRIGEGSLSITKIISYTLGLTLAFYIFLFIKTKISKC